MFKTKLLVIIWIIWIGTFLDRFNNKLVGTVPIGTTKLPNFVPEYRHHDTHHSKTVNDYDDEDDVGVDDLEPDNYDYSSDDLDYNDEEDKEKSHKNVKKSKDNSNKKLASPDGHTSNNDLDYPYPAPPPKPSHDKRKHHHKKHHHHHHHHSDKSKHQSTAAIHDKSIPDSDLEPNQRFQVINLNFNVGNFGRVEAKGKLFFDIDLFLKAMKKMK